MTIQQDTQNAGIERELNVYIQELISQYLKANQLNETFNALQLELNKSLTEVSLDEDLTSIIRDRINFNKLEERHRLARESNTVTTPHQSQLIKDKKIELPIFKFPYPHDVAELSSSLQNKSLCIHTSFAELVVQGEEKNCLLFTYADKKIVIYDIDSAKILTSVTDTVANRLIFSFENYILTCNMNGELIFHEIDSNMQLVKLASFKLHNRLITSLKLLRTSNGDIYICSIGFDFKLCVNKLDLPNLKLQEIGSVKMASNPTCIECTIQNDKPMIFVGTLDSSLIAAFTITESSELKEAYKIALNDAEFNNHSFHPMSIICEKDLLIISTNHIPYMRLITVMIPTIESEQDTSSIKRNLIISNINTMSIQDKYSNTIMFNRTNGKGVIIVGDDGIIRGVDIKNGDIVEMANVKKRSKTACYVHTSAMEALGVCSTDKEMVFLQHRI